MPLYEYKCEKCGDIFEVMQKFADEPITTHDKCGGKVERLISAPSLQFKGSGFYITDYGNSGSGKPADNGSSKNDTAAKSSGGSESSSSSTPASTPSTDSKSSSSESKAGSSASKSSSSESK